MSKAKGGRGGSKKYILCKNCTKNLSYVCFLQHTNIMYVRMYVCMYVFMYLCIYVFMLCIYVMYLCMYVLPYVCIIRNVRFIP